jgi:hypothetical protein
MSALPLAQKAARKGQYSRASSLLAIPQKGQVTMGKIEIPRRREKSSQTLYDY